MEWRTGQGSASEVDIYRSVKSVNICWSRKLCHPDSWIFVRLLGVNLWNILYQTISCLQTKSCQIILTVKSAKNLLHSLCLSLHFELHPCPDRNNPDCHEGGRFETQPNISRISKSSIGEYNRGTPTVFV